VSIGIRRYANGFEDVQLPSAVTKLRASLADVEVADLRKSQLAAA
jgi:hypothetical protein